MLTLDECILKLAQFKAMSADKYGVEQIGVFGSVARGEQTEESDIDVAYVGRADILARVSITRDLESLLGRRVDVIRLCRQLEGTEFGQNIMNELIYV